MLTTGSSSIRASNNANTNLTLGHWIPEATEQNLLKFILHEVQSTFSVLGDKIFAGKRFYQPLIFESTPEVSQTQTNFKQTTSVLNESFAHSLTPYHAHSLYYYIFQTS